LIEDALRLEVLLFRSTKAVQAENLFLRRQLALRQSNRLATTAKLTRVATSTVEAERRARGLYQPSM
jgi:hypothetical protein